EKSRGFQVELAQVGAGGEIAGVQRDRAFKFGPHLARQAERRKRIGDLRFASQGASQPHVIRAVARLQGHRFLRHAHRVVPEFKLEVDAAKKVIGLGIVGIFRERGIEDADGLVSLAGLEQGGRIGISGERCSDQEQKGSQPEKNPQRSTTFTSMPLRSGCALIAPSATMVPSEIPFTTSTRVRLERPVCTSWACSLSLAI